MEKWFRNALLATAVMNLGGAIMFIPPFRFGREMLGFPDVAHPLYLWIIFIWITAFGTAYLFLALSERYERLFISVAAVGKLTFALLLIIYWLIGEVSLTTALAGSGDLFFGGLFLWWLYLHRNDDR